MKKLLYLLPRVIVYAYPLIIVFSTIIDSIRLGFNLRGAIILFGLSAALALVAFLATKWPKVGGVILTVLGLVVVIGASNTSIGVDWMGLISGGLPLTLAGLLFLYEGFSKKTGTKTST